MLVFRGLNTLLCPIKVNCNTIELTVRTSCYLHLDLLRVTDNFSIKGLSLTQINQQITHYEVYLSIYKYTIWSNWLVQFGEVANDDIHTSLAICQTINLSFSNPHPLMDLK